MLITLLRQSLALAILLMLLLEGRWAQAPDGLRAQSGFRLERVAGGEHLAAAQAFAWDVGGQPWVLVGGERLLVLDTRVDGMRVFAEGLQQATAFLLSDAGVLLADANGIQRLDADGVHTAQLLAGENSGLRVTDMAWSLDGYIYAGLAGTGSWSCGDGLSLVPGVFRMGVDGTRVEQIAKVQQGVSSLDVDWQGEVFFSTAEAVDSGRQLGHVVLPERSFLDGVSGALSAWQQLPGASGIGVHVYGGGAWPAQFEASMFVCDSEQGRVWRFGSLAAGSSYQLLGGTGAAFISSIKENFHPVALGGGPSGALYILDADAESGSLWRMQHNARRGNTLTPIPSFDPKAPAALLPELASTNLWRRLEVQRSLAAQRLDDDVLHSLSGMARNSQSPLIQLHALWLGAGGAEYLSWCLKNYVASVRRNALAVAEDRFEGGRRRVAPGSILSLVRDADARVRLQALQTWRLSLGPSNAADLIALYPSLRDDYARGLLLAIAVEHPVAIQKAIFRVREAERYGDLLSAVAQRVAAEGSGREAMELLMSVSAGAKTPGLQARVLTALHTHGRSRDKPWPSPRLSSILRRLGDSQELQLALAALPLAHAWGADQISSSRYREWSQRAIDTLQGTQADLDLRVLAARALLAMPGTREAGISFAGILLGLELSDAQQVLLVGELGTGEELVAGAVIVRSLGRLGEHSLGLAQAKLLGRSAWIEALLDALESGAISHHLINAAWRQRLATNAQLELAARARNLFDAPPKGD